MIKPLIILFNTVSVLFFSFFFGDSPVTVTGNFPKNAPIGSEFTAEVKVNKGSVSGFAKLQLEVPAGFTVKELDSKSGNFSFASNIAKIIWTSMPSDAEFTVKFTLSADASAAGSKVIASKFSYVSNNNKEVAEMTPAEITIGDGVSTPVAATTPAATSNTSETPVTTTSSTENNPPASTTNTSFENPTEPNSNIVCSRKITNISSNSYNVEIRIKKGAIKGFAKFQEILPNGFNAKGDKLNGSSFSVSDGKLKFVWVSLPADEELVLSYILENTGATSAETKLDNGEFSYLENDQSKKIKFPVDVITNNASAPVATSNNTNTEPVTPTAVATQTVTPEPIATQTQTTTPEPVATTNATNTEPVKTEPTPTTNTPANNTSEVVAKKQGNVVYNVQIGAFTNSIESSVLEKKFNISESIKSEMQGGYNKFMVGNFSEYKEARSHRETIKQKGCQSAFVVAYNGAKRITVQEALMITSQKWFK